MTGQETTYFEKLKVSWLLFWRGTIMGLAVAFIWDYLLGVVWQPLGIPLEWAQRMNVFGGYVISVILVGPLLINMLVRKQFNGFRMEFIRSPK